MFNPSLLECSLPKREVHLPIPSKKRLGASEKSKNTYKAMESPYIAKILLIKRYQKAFGLGDKYIKLKMYDSHFCTNRIGVY